MNDVLKIAGITVLGATLSLMLKRSGRESALLCAAAAGLLALLGSIRQLMPAVNAVYTWAGKISTDHVQTQNMLKMLAAALISELAAQFCRDLGDDGLAQKALLSGQWILLGMTIPLLLEIGDHLLQLLPGSSW